MANIGKVTKEVLLEAVRRVPEAARRGKWVLTLDKDEGTFFYSPKIIPQNTELFQVTDEYAVYLNTKREPQGVVVEYWQGNYEKHHPSIAELSKGLFAADKDVIVINPAVKKKKKDVEDFLVLFESMLIAEVHQGGHCV